MFDRHIGLGERSLFMAGGGGHRREKRFGKQNFK